nr:long-chain fatty acid--CoA ligase [Corynebacterium stationis]
MQETHTPAEFEILDNETCLTALMDTAKARPHGVMFTRPANYEWVNVTAKEFIREVFDVAKGIIAAGVEQGDRIIIISETRYEWSLLDFAVWAAGAVSVPVYPSSSLSQVRWVVEDSGAVLAITESQDHTELVQHLLVDDSGNPSLSGSTSQLRRILEINSSAIDTLKFEGRSLPDDVVDERIAATSTNDLASLVYTSGTTGKPKGCILTHKNWLAEVRGLLTNPIGAIAVPGSRVLTFLPMAHVFSRAVSLAVAVGGATQNHWSDFSSLSVEFQRSRPNLILGVPRVFEKVRNSAAQKAADGSAFKRGIFEQAEQAAIEYSKALDTEEGPTRIQKAKHKVFDRMVYSKIREGVGGSVRYCITGGSAMGQDLLHWFRGIGVPVYEGYGLTEVAAAVTVDFDDRQIGTVGPPIGGMTVRTNGVGEILVKGPTVFAGYWNNEEATKEALHGEWYNTGDLGEILDNGKLMITGRKKDLIVTAGGKNVSPGPMEDILRAHPLVSQAMVVGDGKPFVGVLITLDPDILKRWKLDRNIPENRSTKELATEPQLRAEIQDAINEVNATVSHAEAIKKFYILESDLTEEENELTPTLKVKRNVVAQRYSDAIDHLYTR